MIRLAARLRPAALAGWIVPIALALSSSSTGAAANDAIVAERCEGLLADLPKTRCGRLEVPLDHARPGGRRISIFVTALLAEREARDRPPVVYLSGGPGQSGSGEAAQLAGVFADLRRNRTVLLVDQRGTGRARPSLTCPNVPAVAVLTGTVTAEAVAACRGQLGLDRTALAAFTTEQAARDVARLRDALNIDRWDVIGTSYGAALALALLRVDPGGVRSLVLNSPALRAGGWRDPDRARAIADAFRRLFADCAAVPACAAAAPDLRDAYDRVAQRLRHRSESGWAEAWSALVLRLGAGAAAATVPGIIVRFDRDPAATSESLTRAALPGEIGLDGQRFALMLNLATSCMEDRPADRTTLATLVAKYRPYLMPGLDPNLDTACPVLGLPAVTAPEPAGLPQRPVLMLSGLYDTFTPPTVAGEVASAFPSARFAAFRGYGHDLLATSRCARGLLERFLGAPEAPLTADCAELHLPPPFPNRAAP